MSCLPKEVKESLDSLREHYEIESSNDRGANGYLYFGTNKISKADVAIKFYCGEAGERRHDEPRQLSAIRSSNVLTILDARNISNDWAYFITPRCFDGDLDDLIERRPSVYSAIHVALGICNGVSAIHALGMLHRDLKPGNIVLYKGEPRIADFGSVRALDADQNDMPASRHTILYRPPESFSTDRYSVKGDIYQIGVVTYQLLGGVLPYEGCKYFNSREKKEYALIKDHADQSIFENRVIQKIAEKGKLLRFESLPPWVNASAKRALRSMTNYNPAMRFSNVSDVAAALTQMRAILSDWEWDGTNARLVTHDRIIELREQNDGNFEAFQIKGDHSRRMPGVPICSLAEILKKIKK